jgi:hypothetical protein
LDENNPMRGIGFERNTIPTELISALKLPDWIDYLTTHTLSKTCIFVEGI